MSAGHRLLFAALALAAGHALAAESEWVRPGSDGKLIYKTTPAGDRIMDFSHAGYMGGGVALPHVPVKQTVRPSGDGDDSAAIQRAIDEVAALPLETGLRGAVLLAPGVFRCSNTLTISASGLVLRGSGSTGETTRTTIRLTGKPHNAIAIRGSAGRAGSDEKFEAAQTIIADRYVPSGTNRFTVADATGFVVGDTIEIRRPVTADWIRFMQMDDLVRDGKPQTWIRPGGSTTAERRIAAVSGKIITVEVPLSDSFDSKYLNPPGTAVVKIRPPARVSQVGLEDLHIECPPQEINHTEPHFSALRITAEDAWVRDVVIDETMNSVGLNGRRITLQRVAVNRKARHQGSSKPAEFAPNAGQVLLDHCTSVGDNVWYAATGGGVSGPIVLLHCTFLGNGRVESHQRWSTGMLYDNCRVPDGGMDFRNRGAMGSGHGWSMGWGVAWNCEAKDFVIQNPPGAANWMIGCLGANRPMPRPFGSAPNLAEGIKDSPGSPVTPPSLYLAQLAERLGPQALTPAAGGPSERGNDWPQFRGRGALGRGEAGVLPLTWSDGKNITWKTVLPGPGASSPIVVGNRIFLTCFTGFATSAREPGEMTSLKRHLLALSLADGKIIWNTPVPAEMPEQDRIRENHGYASSTPVADAERIYTFFGKSGVLAFDHSGKQLWQTKVGDTLNGWGSATSPVLYKNVVIVNASIESESLVALDKITGREVWRAGGIKDSWHAPVFVNAPDGQTEVVVAMMRKVLAFDPDEGAQRWRCDTGINWYMCPTPVAENGIVYVIGGRTPNGALAIRAGGRGDITGSHVVWRLNKGSNVPSPILHNDHLYFAHENLGIVYCVNAKSGAVVYEERLEPSPGQIYASPVVAGERIYYTARGGHTVVIAARPKFEKLADNILESNRGVFNSSPALSGHRLLLRSNRALYCLGEK